MFAANKSNAGNFTQGTDPVPESALKITKCQQYFGQQLWGSNLELDCRGSRV